VDSRFGVCDELLALVVEKFALESRRLLILALEAFRTICDELDRGLAAERCDSGARAKLIHHLVDVLR